MAEMKFIAQTNLNGDIDVLWEVNNDVQRVATLYPVLEYTPDGHGDYNREVDEEKTELVYATIMTAPQVAEQLKQLLKKQEAK